MQPLSWLFITPFIASLIAFFFPIGSGHTQKRVAFFLSLIPLALLLIFHESWIGSDINLPWLAQLSVHFHLNIDSLSLIFLYLTAIVVPISILATNSEEMSSPNIFFGLVLLLEGLLIGFFTARDLVVFTVFYESMLIPLYFIINLWGGPGRHSAAIKFLVYMFAGSALLIASILFLYTSSGTFSIDELVKTAGASKYAPWILGFFLLAFAVKTPLFPFHAWLPDAYCQSSTSGTILLSALLSKAGIYGILRVALELFPDLMKEWSPFLIALAIIGVFYGGFAAWAENDYKKLVAYSSLSHVNLILVGLFVWNTPAQWGGIIQAFNHGITITGLFLVAGWLEQRIGSTHMGSISGLGQFLTRLCWLTLFFILSSVALPGLNNFIGELMIFLGLFKYNPWLAGILGLTVILSIIYSLRWIQKMYFQEPNFFQEKWVDIGAKELLISLPLIFLIIWVGVYPAPLLNLAKPYADQLQAETKVETTK
jgi:NADH-quinone oxidoreductase subunit M